MGLQDLLSRGGAWGTGLQQCSSFLRQGLCTEGSVGKGRGGGISAGCWFRNNPEDWKEREEGWWSWLISHHLFTLRCARAKSDAMISLSLCNADEVGLACRKQLTLRCLCVCCVLEPKATQ